MKQLRTEDGRLAPEVMEMLDESLVEAMRLQVARMEMAFGGGWRPPEGVCDKYRARYLALASLSDNDRCDAYRMLFDTFVAEIESAGGFHTSLNGLDHITVFGEICTGERTENASTPSLRPTHTLH